MKRISIVFCLLSIALVIAAETLVLSPSDDMYSDHNHPGVNPVTTELWTANFPSTSNYQRIMMRFDLQDLNVRSIESATLHLTRFYSCPSGGTTTVKFYAISRDWSEASWDHTQHISYHEDTGMNYVFSGTGGSAIVNFDVDFSSFLIRWLEEGLENYGFVIIANTNQKFSKFYSKEHPNEAYRPKLSINYSSSSNHDSMTSVILGDISNHPNPFANQTDFYFENSKHGSVRLQVFNSRGQLVSNQDFGRMPAGNHIVNWRALDTKGARLPKGLYYYRLVCNNETRTGKMIII
jgi:hypothetical protein